ncbi:hypothetical protein GGR56DRAFT_651732 [Xylariaceae sp. FL0804]|nr:hypothetical protein GGR56DRAFT_651732 [Xylariaceae sp. FL0804]
MAEAHTHAASADDQSRPRIANSGTTGSVKRSHDYGEELKGLATSSDDSSDEDRLPSPASKRQKVDQGGHRSASDSLDDGEIVEPSSLPQPVGTLSEPQSQNNEAPNMSRRVPSEHDGVAGEPAPEMAAGHPQSAPIGGWNGVGLGMRTSFGTKPLGSLFKKSSETGNSVQTAAMPLGNPPEPLHKNAAHSESQSVPDVSGRPGEVANGVPSTFKSLGKTWILPNIPSVLCEDTVTTEMDFWVEKLKLFTVLLLRANRDNTIHLIDWVALRKGWKALIHTDNTDSAFLLGAKKPISRAKHAAFNAAKSFDESQQSKLLSDARNELDSEKDGNLHPVEESVKPEETVQPAVSDYAHSIISISSEDFDNGAVQQQSRVSTDDELLQHQCKYFPSASAEDSSQFCLLCSSKGHGARACPQQNCRFCASNEHNSFGCPSRQRCTKCLQLGHSIETCQEKLALAPGEQGSCAFCCASHADDACSQIWRSYDPSATDIKKVNNILASCYVCGARYHYGPECGLLAKRDKAKGPSTWSQANRNIYVDPTSEATALALIGLDLSTLDNKTRVYVPGPAKRNTHLHFVSSDESEEDLVHAPVKKSQPRGGIKIASNIGSAPGGSRRAPEQSRRRQNEREFSPPPALRDPPDNSKNARGASWQPPLPPGPPPQHSQGQGSFPQPPPSSLPPRPNFNFGDARQPPGNQNGRGGRGGPRGRGHGRGRGRGRGN